MTLPPSKHGGNLQKLAQEANRSLEEIIDFSASINPLGPPPYFRAVISRQLGSLLHYPDPDYTALIAVLAEHYDLAPEQIVLGNGSSELIYALPRVVQARRAVIPAPAYSDYQRAATLAGLEVETPILNEEDGFHLDLNDVACRLRGNEIVFLGRPNNPTGLLPDEQGVIDLIASHPATSFIIDEAFAEFCPDLESLAKSHMPNNCLVLRSLTKFYAIPGLRLGFGAAAPGLASRLREQLPPWSVNTLALALGQEMVSDQQYAKRTHSLVEGERQFLAQGLRKLPGLTVFESTVNYLLVKCEEKTGIDALTLRTRLLAEGMAIRVCDSFAGLDTRFFRLAVRSRQENDLLLHALGRILEPTKTVRPKKRTPSLMFQGAGSDAGKSILTAGLCRVLLQDGVRVAPFKAQNMSLNSFVTREGHEMGRAQVVQAQACLLDPEVRMNPVLLKPSSDVGSQVIVHGKPVGNMSVEAYVEYKPKAFAAAKEAYDSLAAEFEAVILEGAGSPAEVNLKHHDIVNMRMARYAGSPVLLIGDIDRGGVFASFVGCMEVLEEWERRLVAGFVVNRFRGRAALLEDAYRYVEKHTGKPVLGLIPYLKDLGLPEEDSVSFKKGLFDQEPPAGDHVEICLIDLPHISNFTDFEPFLTEPDVHLRVVRSPAELGRPDAILLPGSKNVINDLAFLKSSGLAGAISRLAENGGPEIVGICGGFQMLGRVVEDPYGIEGSGSQEGLGLLDLTTVLEKEKTLTRQTAIHRDSGLEVHGYEIHHGQTPSNRQPVLREADGSETGASSEDGRIWGSYLHGIFDADSFRHWFIEGLRQKRGLAPWPQIRPVYDLEDALNRLADQVRAGVNMETVYRLLGL